MCLLVEIHNIGVWQLILQMGIEQVPAALHRATFAVHFSFFLSMRYPFKVDSERFIRLLLVQILNKWAEPLLLLSQLQDALWVTDVVNTACFIASVLRICGKPT